MTNTAAAENIMAFLREAECGDVVVVPRHKDPEEVLLEAKNNISRKRLTSGQKRNVRRARLRKMKRDGVLLDSH